MAIIKEKKFYKGELLEQNQFQICEKISYIENGVVLSSHLQRHVLVPLDDYSKESDEVKAVCDKIFTKDAKNDYQDFIDNMEV